MKRLIIIMLMVLLAVSGIAADKKSEQSPDKGESATETKKTPDKQVSGKEKAPQWPRPFKATEEVSADSTVPFPTDI